MKKVRITAKKIAKYEDLIPKTNIMIFILFISENLVKDLL